MNVGRNRSTFDPEYDDETNPKRKAFDEVRARTDEKSAYGGPSPGNGGSAPSYGGGGGGGRSGYRRDNDCMGCVDEARVEQLLVERDGYRRKKEYETADRIKMSLTAMGVRIDDKKKTWANESKEARAAGVEYVPMAFLVEWVRDGGRSGALKAFNAELLDAWLSYITFTPSRRNDDDALIDFAKGKLHQGHECYLVTNDNFKDHIEQGKITDKWFKQHVVGYMWLGRSGELQLMPDSKLEGVLPGLCELAGMCA